MCMIYLLGITDFFFTLAPVDARETSIAFYAELMRSPDLPSFQRLSGELGLALAKARRYELACLTISPPDEKPHTLEPNPFHMHPDRSASFSIGKIREHGAFAIVDVHLTLQAETWNDQLVLRKSRGRWEVVDVLFSADDRLTKRLQKFARQACLPNS